MQSGVHLNQTPLCAWMRPQDLESSRLPALHWNAPQKMPLLKETSYLKVVVIPLFWYFTGLLKVLGYWHCYSLQCLTLTGQRGRKKDKYINAEQTLAAYLRPNQNFWSPVAVKEKSFPPGSENEIMDLLKGGQQHRNCWSLLGSLINKEGRAHPYLNHSYDMAGVQQVNHSLGRKFEANLHPKCHAQGNQQQVLA